MRGKHDRVILFYKKKFLKNIVKLLRKHCCYGTHVAPVGRGRVRRVVHGMGLRCRAFLAPALGSSPQREDEKSALSVQSGVWRKPSAWTRAEPLAVGFRFTHLTRHGCQPVSLTAGLGTFGPCVRAVDVRSEPAAPCGADPCCSWGACLTPAHSGPPFRLHCGHRGRSHHVDVLFTVLAFRPISSLPASIFLVYYFSNCTIPRHSS